MRTTSRRDDLISLSFLLVYLLDSHLSYLAGIDLSQWDHEKVKIDLQQQDGSQDIYKSLLESRLCLKASDLCCSSLSQHLLPFTNEVFKYDFDDEPDYNYLEECLEELLDLY